MSDLQSTLVFAHRKSIDRYRRLLKTRLTVIERDFIMRRLGEEERALLEVVEEPHSLIVSTHHDWNPVMEHE